MNHRLPFGHQMNARSLPPADIAASVMPHFPTFASLLNEWTNSYGDPDIQPIVSSIAVFVPLVHIRLEVKGGLPDLLAQVQVECSLSASSNHVFQNLLRDYQDNQSAFDSSPNGCDLRGTFVFKGPQFHLLYLTRLVKRLPADVFAQAWVSLKDSFYGRTSPSATWQLEYVEVGLTLPAFKIEKEELVEASQRVRASATYSREQG